jgi:hypothetical protein
VRRTKPASLTWHDCWQTAPLWPVEQARPVADAQCSAGNLNCGQQASDISIPIARPRTSPTSSTSTA